MSSRGTLLPNAPDFEPKPARAHQGRDRFFGAVFVGLIAVGLVSLYYSLNLITLVIFVGLVVLIVAIGWLAGSIGAGTDR